MKAYHSQENKKVKDQTEYKLVNYKGMVITDEQYADIRAQEEIQAEKRKAFEVKEVEISEITDELEEKVKAKKEAVSRREELMNEPVENLREIYKDEVGKNVAPRYMKDKNYMVDRILSLKD